MRNLLFGVFLTAFIPFAKAQKTISVPLTPGTVSVADQNNPADSLWCDSVITGHSCLWNQKLNSRLSELLGDDLLKTTQMGMCVYDITADTLLFDHHMHYIMRPASTAKLLTAITALHNLGGTYKYETSLFIEGSVTDSVLNGNVYVKGGMDPMFGDEDMRAFANALVENGIRCIAGDIYADVSLKDTLKWGAGWCWDDDMNHLTPLLYDSKDCFMQKFFGMLDEVNIVTKDSFSYKCTPENEGVVCISNRCHTIDQILVPMLKISDNTYAESLFYQIGAKEGHHYADAKTSAGYITDIIRDLGLSPDDYRIADGSGVSLYNYASPELLMRMLCYAYRRPDIFEHLYPALPIAGYDGSLAKRMRKTSAQHNVHAKTGTLEGVSSLAGYAVSPDNHMLVFAIMNQGILHQRTARNLQDRICVILTEK